MRRYKSITSNVPKSKSLVFSALPPATHPRTHMFQDVATGVPTTLTIATTNANTNAPTNAPYSRQCANCGEIKPLTTSFGTKGRGRLHVCKECRAESLVSNSPTEEPHAPVLHAEPPAHAPETTAPIIITLAAPPPLPSTQRPQQQQDVINVLKHLIHEQEHERTILAHLDQEEARAKRTLENIQSEKDTVKRRVNDIDVQLQTPDFLSVFKSAFQRLYPRRSAASAGTSSDHGRQAPH